VDSTVIRHVSMTVMLVAPRGPISDDVALRFERARVLLTRISSSAAACERMAVAMPQVVVVLGSVTAEERDALNDRATAVGALVMYVDPALDDATMQELVERAARVAIERSLAREQASEQGETTTQPPTSSADVVTQPPTAGAETTTEPPASGVDIDVTVDDDDLDSKW
jgi:hypothetical protein